MPDPIAPLSWPQALERIAARAQDIDIRSRWPAENLEDLRQCSGLAWAVPAEDGGLALDPAELHRRYAQLASVCLTTTLILTQRDSAVGFLIGADRDHGRGDLARRLLSQLATGQTFATIGIAQLTTSGLHKPAAITARSAPGGYLISGRIPWATGAADANWIVVGAALQDGQQILAALDTTRPGVTIPPPMALPALNGSHTGEVHLHDVFIPHEEILRQPTDNALAGRAAVRAFALPTCILPLGLAAGAVAMAKELAPTRTPAVQAAVAKLASQHAALEKEIFQVGLNPDAYPMAELSPRLRAAANSLASRASLAALELSKGAGFLLEHPAQRRAREALFFFVWSSPNGVIERTMELLAGGG